MRNLIEGRREDFFAGEFKYKFFSNIERNITHNKIVDYVQNIHMTNAFQKKYCVKSSMQSVH